MGTVPSHQADTTQPRKKNSDEKTSKDEVFVKARHLNIIWGEDNRYWQWPDDKETREEVAELLNVCWFELKGTYEISKLTPGKKYEVVFHVKLQEQFDRWDEPMKVKLTLPDGHTEENKVNLNDMKKLNWFEIRAGEFTVKPKMEGSITFSMYEYDSMNWKSGLLLKGATIRAKN